MQECNILTIKVTVSDQSKQSTSLKTLLMYRNEFEFDFTPGIRDVSMV